MKYFPFRTLALCIFLPPVLYIFSILSLENRLREQYVGEIENIYTGSPDLLFDGSIRLTDAISKNIDLYLKNKTLTALGVTPDITVLTQKGTILYPSFFEDTPAIIIADPNQVAAENFTLMQEGLVVRIDLKIEHNTMLSNILLGIYILTSLLVLFFFHRKGVKRFKAETRERENETHRLLALEKDSARTLQYLEEKRKHLSSELLKMDRKLKNEKVKATKNEDDMIEEIVVLEKKIEETLTLQKEQQAETARLKEKIAHYEKQKSPKQKIKAGEAVEKRFRALYKNISISKRAIDGFIDLTEDLKIKSEEIIHNLNHNPDLVPIKRKVFGKKNRGTVFEVLFAYKGRLYFRKIKDNRIEILTIGTKNTQTKDLDFLAKF